MFIVFFNRVSSSKEILCNYRQHSPPLEREPDLSDSDSDEDEVEDESHSAKVKLVHAAIDIGTTYSGYAYMFKHDHAKKTNIIHANRWMNSTQAQMNVKTPTCLLLHSDKSLHSFGHTARDAYAEFCLDKSNTEYYFFWTFKMSLHQDTVNEFTLCFEIQCSF